MENNSSNLIIQELNNIIQNKPISQDFLNHDFADGELVELHDAICYLSNSFEEVRIFLQSISQGNIEVEPPGRNNFLADPLKELHSVAKYIVWKSSQVANGDYNQRIDHLGAFSDSFNLMVQLLKERESKLKKSAVSLEHSLKLLTSIIEMQEDWVLVIDTSSKKIVYANESAKDYFYNPDTRETHSKEECPLLQMLLQTQQTEEELQFEYSCENCLRCISIKSFPIEWNGADTMVHLLKDITKRKNEEEQLSSLAYRDELTGIYNRRYCVETLQKIMSSGISFSIVLIDLDNLKYVNDTFGHQAGDFYICSVLEIIKENIRETDILSRVGGDEFIIILHQCSEQLATYKMEDIRNKLKRKEGEYCLSFSYGTKYVSYNKELNIDSLIKELDERMYAYKKKYKKFLGGSK